MRRVRHCMLCRMGESHFFARLRGPTRLDFAPQLTHVPLRAGCGGCGPRGLRAWRLLLCLRRRHTRLACPCCVCPRRRVCIAPRPLAPRGWRRCGRGHGHAARCCHQRFAPRAAERRSRRSCEAHASRNAATATALRQRATAGHRGRRARAAARASGGGGARSGCGGRGSACARTAAEIKRAGARRPPAVRQRAAARATRRHLDGTRSFLRRSLAAARPAPFCLALRPGCRPRGRVAVPASAAPAAVPAGAPFEAAGGMASPALLPAQSPVSGVAARVSPAAPRAATAAWCVPSAADAAAWARFSNQHAAPVVSARRLPGAGRRRAASSRAVARHAAAAAGARCAARGGTAQAGSGCAFGFCAPLAAA